MTDTFPLGPTIGGESWAGRRRGMVSRPSTRLGGTEKSLPPHEPHSPGSDIIVEPRLIPLIPTRGNSGRGRPFHMF